MFFFFQEEEERTTPHRLTFISAMKMYCSFLMVGYFVFGGHKATEKMTLITKPAAAYILLHKIIFIDAI